MDTKQAAGRLGVDPEILANAVAARNIQPRFIRDGEPVYELEEITGAAQLLRPSEPPNPAGLLRPATSTQPTPETHLLRPDELSPPKSYSQPETKEPIPQTVELRQNDAD